MKSIFMLPVRLLPLAGQTSKCSAEREKQTCRSGFYCQWAHLNSSWCVIVLADSLNRFCIIHKNFGNWELWVSVHLAVPNLSKWCGLYSRNVIFGMWTARWIVSLHTIHMWAVVLNIELLWMLTECIDILG